MSMRHARGGEGAGRATAPIRSSRLPSHGRGPDPGRAAKKRAVIAVTRKLDQQVVLRGQGDLLLTQSSGELPPGPASWCVASLQQVQGRRRAPACVTLHPEPDYTSPAHATRMRAPGTSIA